MRKIPTIIAILVLVVGTAAGIILVATSKQFRLGASPDITPQDVRVTNITPTSFTVSWITDKPSVGFIKYGTSKDSLNQSTPAPQTSQSIHWIQVQSLSPQSQYFFKINSDGFDFDNNGLPWSGNTAPQISGQAPVGVLSGSVEDQGGLPAAGVVVYVTIQGASPLSASTSANGSWVLPLGSARTTNLANYPTISSDSSLLQIFVQGGVAGVATAQAYPKGANPTPVIKLGQIYDFRNQTSLSSVENPSSSLTLPETSTASSTFNLSQIASPSGTPKAVTVTSIKNGETITTTKPEIIGSGTPGTKITITVQSTPQSGTATVGPNGTWVWTPPANLDPGTHTLTVSWKDASGILQTLTRTFTVLAAEGPAFVSTPSGSLTATPAPTGLPTPIPTQAPRVSLPSTESAIPQSGTLTPTLALSMMGIVLVISSFILWKKLEI